MTTRGPAHADCLRTVGHPCRVEILRSLLKAGTTTPRAIADAVGLPLGNVSYHIRALASQGVITLAGRTQRRGAVVNHYQLADREWAASILWGIQATLLVTGFERQNGRGDVTAQLDAHAVAELRSLTAAYLARIGELALQTRERRNATEAGGRELTSVAVLLASDEATGA